MSSIKTTELEGDLSVGRHLGVGGNANVQGNATVKKNLKVEGWLDAKNIKGPNKGIFLDVVKLREAYPLPHDGWWALVGKSLPAPLYVADGGAWVATGENAGNPTIDSQQYNDAVQELDADLKGVSSKVTANAESIKNLQTYINTIGETVNTHTVDITNLKERMTNTETVINARGRANGIATLGTDGKVPAVQLPSFVDDVVEFEDYIKDGEVETEAEPAQDSNNKDVVYYEVTGAFLLRENAADDEVKYYSSWLGSEKYGILTDGKIIPVSDKVYVCKQQNKTYRWSGTQLVGIGSDLTLGHTESTAYPGNEGAALADNFEKVKTNFTKAEEKLNKVTLINLNAKDAGAEFFSLSSALSSVNQSLWEPGVVLTFILSKETEAGVTKKWVAYQWKATEVNSGLWSDVKMWEKFGGGSASVGNTYNVTVELPLPQGEYYTDIKATEQAHNVLEAVFGAGVASLGLQITFAIGVNSWKTYQYTGVNTTREQVLKSDNWIDLAGMSAGGEAIINVNDLCGDKDYTLSTAVDALIELETSTGIGYRKEGLVITYRRDADSNTWETKQYIGKITDMTATNEKQWVDFGGGGNKVETTDTAEKDSDKAITSGGVFDALQTKPIVNFNDESTAEDYVMQGVNEKGEKVGDPIRIPRSNGAGTQSGSTLNIYPETQAVWGAFGSKIKLKAAIKSVSFDGETEIYGTVKTVAILDALTRIVLWSNTVNQASSTSATNFSFEFDFTDFISEASSRDFIIQATDADGNTKTRTITVTAVDVTCTSINTLNYSSATALEVGGGVKSLPMYKFENNVSTKQGILVKTEIYYNGAWKLLGTATVTDSYSHNISIDPKNVFGGGEQLSHGAYPIRIHGTDLASGVEGNTVYTAVMCIDVNNTHPIVAIRYNDNDNGAVRLYDTLSIDVAAYTPNKTSTQVKVVMDNHTITTMNAISGQSYKVSRQVQGYKSDGSQSIEVYAQSGDVKSTVVSVKVKGSAIDAIVKDGTLFDFDFSTRNNDEADHSVTDGDFEMSIIGSNFSSNGFTNVLGENVFRCAENVKATIPWQMFSSTALETSGAAFQMAFSTNSIKDNNAKLCECYDPATGAGFYICGNKIVLSVAGGTPKEQKVSFKNGEKITVAIVVEPGSKYVTYKADSSAAGTNYSFVKLYVNGEECAAIGYQPGTSALRQAKPITFNSENGDINVNYVIAYNSYMEWLQAFQNYLCKLSNVTAMIAEYDKENVLDTTGKPSMTMMEAHGIPYYVVVADQTTFNNYDYALNGGTDTSDQFACTLYYFNPKYPCLSFKAINTLWRRQGTTSAQRPIKNDRFNFNKKNKSTGLKATVTLLHPDENTALGRKAIMAAKHNKVLVDPDGFAVDVITVKVDYSDSSNANDCGVCNMMNATFRSLGADYMTPAQRAFNGTQDLGGSDVLTGIHLDHSTKNHPIAAFRATTDTLQDAWFHAKGNWKEDKAEQTALGFKDTPGYNLGCLNYGDFIEFFGTKDESLEQAEARFKNSEDLDTSKPYLISQYCGQDYAIYRYKGNEWVRSTGSMKQVNGKWTVTGDVLNPVTGYELLQYAGMDWWQGVGSVEDMMRPSTQMSSWVRKLKLAATEYPAWTYYFECMVDNDQLQIDLALGKKVPYELFNLLRFFDSCDYSKVSGWRDIWKKNAFRYMSMESTMAYTAFTDYSAAVDQRAKNMQPMFFLEDGCSVENGVYSGYKTMLPIRMYLNKIYDCDTCNESDNDGGKSIDAEVDPNKPTDEHTGYTNPYMGSGSVLFNDIDKEPEVWNSNDLGATTISLKSVVNRMRNQTAEIDGRTIVPFSPDGASYFFVESILKFWPKVISSYDGERKYIHHTNIANLPYFYALHGLGLTSLPRFIEQRWAIRDGYYQTGDFFTNPLSGRMSAIKPDAKIYITAAKTGYFGIGNDASGQLSETVFLEAGQSHAFTTFAHDAGALLYIYQPGRMSKIDLSEMTLAFHLNDLSKLLMCEEIVLGGEKHTTNTSLNGFDPLGSIVLGNMPFLRSIDVSNTQATSIDASGCPRLESVKATNTGLIACRISQTSPIRTMSLPGTITSLELVNLPNLSYPGGLTIENMNNISRLWVEGCENINTEALVMAIAEAGAIKEVRIPSINMTASVNILRSLKATGAVGLDTNGNAYEEEGKCSGITGRWILSELVDTSELDSLSAYYPELSLLNSQFSVLRIDDVTENDTCDKYTNEENKTGYKYENDYVPTGHVLAIRKGTHAYKCTYNGSLKQMEGVQLSDNDFTLLANGSSFDISDSAGEGFDIMWHSPHHWYKGVNDYKNQVKYIIYSTTEKEPISTVNKRKVSMLSELLYAENKGVYTNAAVIGNKMEDEVIAVTSNVNTYRMDVDGMKQVRWPGLNHISLGGVFTDEKGVVVGTFNMSITHPYFDFTVGDYIFCNVPAGAKYFYFTAYRDIEDTQCLAVDSEHIEAIEPEWTEHTVGEQDSLVGIYPITIDGLGMPRSVGGSLRSKKGNNNSTTSPAWAMDINGNPTAVPPSLNYTCKDFQNLTRMRGSGYQLQDYEQHKEISNLWYALNGTTNEQLLVSNGAHDTVIGSLDNIGMADSGYAGNANNSILGLKHYVGCDSEWMDYIACNVVDYVTFYKNRCVETNSDPIDYKAHIYDPIKKKERVVQTVTSNGHCVVRLVHGAKCDILPSKVHQTDTSKYNTHYASGMWISANRGRCVLRSGYGSGAYSGLAFASASHASSHSSSYFGGRLAFRGKFVIVG